MIPFVLKDWWGLEGLRKETWRLRVGLETGQRRGVGNQARSPWPMCSKCFSTLPGATQRGH